MSLNLVYDRTEEDETSAAAIRSAYQKLGNWSGLTDAERAQLERGALTYNTLNRVEQAVKTLAAALTSAGYPVEVTPVMKGSSRVPSGYTEVEWIQSSGTQYIDTGAIFSNGVRAETKINLTSITSSSKKTPIFGAHNASEPYGRDYLSIDSSKNFEIGGGAGYRYFKNNTITTNVDYEVEASNIPGQESLVVNGELYKSTGGAAYATPFTDLSLYLFRVNTTNDQWFENASMKLYYMKMYDYTNVLVRDYIPCKNSDGVVGMYDIIERKFYTLPALADLPAEYTRVEYIQSNGAQYIDTGIKPNQNTRIDAEVETTDTGIPYFFWGARTSSETVNFCLLRVGSGVRADYGESKLKVMDTPSAGKVAISQIKNVCTYGSTTATNTASTFASQYPLYLFAANTGGTAGYFGRHKLYSCKIYDDGALVRNFIPVRNSSGALGLYDTVNGAFYTNEGTGAFTAGNDIKGFTAGPEVPSALKDREWQEGDVLYRPQWTTYLDNVQRLRDAYYTLAETGELPAPGDKLNYTGANTIEKVLADIDLLLDGMKSSYRRCGTFCAGNNAAHLPLKGSI